MSSLSREVDEIIIHCSATPPSADIGAKEIDRMHRQRGFLKIGYHFVIRRDGTIEDGRDLNEVGAHAEGHNRRSIGICLVGGVTAKNKPEANFTAPQWDALETLVRRLLKVVPTPVQILGHNEVTTKKACPCFNVQTWLALGMRPPRFP